MIAALRQLIKRSVLRVLGQRGAVAIREHIQAVGTLDYNRAVIHMTLDGGTQVTRLGACAKEPETVAWLESELRADDVLYDVGANVGAYSFVAQAASHCRVYAFEPSFSTFFALSQNVFLNQCQGKVIPLHVALTGETRLAVFNYSSVAAGSALHSLGDAIDEHGQRFQPAFTQPILSYRLDDFIRRFQIALPTHIKLDVDGGELEVIRGAIETLRHPGLRSLLVEINDQVHADSHLFSLLKSVGFEVRSKHPRRSASLFNYIFERRT